MRKSIPMPEGTEESGRLGLPELIGMSFRPGIPWWVALQQSPPPLSRLPLILQLCFRNVQNRPGHSGLSSLQAVSKKGAVHSGSCLRTGFSGPKRHPSATADGTDTAASRRTKSHASLLTLDAPPLL